MKSNETAPKKGLKKFGFIPNMDYRLAELSALVEGTSFIDKETVDRLVEKASPIYLNSRGWDNFFNTPVTRERAAFSLVPTGLKSAKGDEIYAFFVFDKVFMTFRGLVWGTRQGLFRRVNVMNKFRIGEICFDSEQEGNEFLDAVAARAIPEAWSFKNELSTVSAPILRSYLENILIKLRKEAASGAMDKLIYNDRNNKVMFNTNLLDIFSRDIIVIADVRRLENGDEYLIRPVLSNGNLAQLKAGFSKEDNPAPAEFFQDVRDVVFQTGWTVDEDFDTYRHIIEQRIYRFPKEYQERPTDELARKLKDAIDFLRASGLRVVGFTEKAHESLWKADLTGPLCVMMGSEEDGISPAYLKRLDGHLMIPMPGDIDSLNVSVATGVVCFEIVRQRMG